MEQTIFYCRKCGATYAAAPGTVQKCQDCHGRLTDTGFPVEQWRALTDEQKAARKEAFAEVLTEAPKQSRGAGSAIRIIAVIAGILGIIAGMAVGLDSDWGAGIAIMVLSFLFGAIVYGIGEICALMKSIDNKLQ